ncbi:hypothetical protein [Faecalimonas sp.]
MKLKVLVCGLVVGMLVSSISASAATPKSASDCKATISLTAAKGIFSVIETTTPMNPITPKKIDGNYKCVDINGHYKTQRVSKSVAKGQISEIKYAPNHFKTYMGNMGYYLNGSFVGSVEKKY